jgi:hypothetical protein
MEDFQEFTILPAEFVGNAAHGDDGILRIGTPRSDGSGVVEIRLTKGELSRWWSTKTVSVYVRRFSSDLSVAEILMAQHSGLFDEELAYQGEQAENYPLGPKEYWRSEMVGKYTYGADNHLMTNEEFEIDWEETEKYTEYLDDSDE